MNLHARSEASLEICHDLPQQDTVLPGDFVAEPVRPVGWATYVVDDDAIVRHSLQALIDVVAGVTSIGFPSGEALLAGADSLQPGCILLDHRLSGMNGLAVLGEIQVRKLPLVVILIGGDVDGAITASAVQIGAVAVLAKPFPRSALIEALNAAWQRLGLLNAVNG